MKYIILTLFSLICFYVNGQSYDVIKNYQQLSKEDGLVDNYVTKISDDIYGRIWIGTSGGLNIYNSNHVTGIDHYKGLYISCLFDSGKEMFIGCSDYIEVYDYESGIFSKVLYNNEAIGNLNMVITQDDQYFVLAGGALYIYEDKTLKLKEKDVPYNTLVKDKFATLWGKNEDRVFRLNNRMEIEATYILENTDLSPIHILSIYADSKGTCWVGTVKDGLYRYNRHQDAFRKENIITRYNIQEIENIGSIYEDKYDRLWVGHNSGVVVYDYNNDYLRNYSLENSNNLTINTTVTSLYRTKHNDMVMGTYFTGFFYIHDINTGIKFYNLADFSNKTGGVAANGIFKKEPGELWVSTNSKGITKMDYNGNIIQRYHQGNYGINDNIIAMAQDYHGNIWGGSLSNGLYKLRPDGNVRHYLNHPDDPGSLNGSAVYVLHTLNKDSLIIGTETGIDVYNFNTNRFSRLIHGQQHAYSYANILCHRNLIYFVNFNSIVSYNRSTGEIKEYDLQNYPFFYILCSHVDKEGKLWIGTTAGDLYLFEKEKLIPYLQKNDLINSSICGIQTDNNGNIWLACGNDLICLMRDKGLHKFNLAWGLGKNEFNMRSSYIDDEGHIFFGTSDGFISFDPNIVQIQEKPNPELFISDFKLFNESVSIGDNSILNKQIHNTEKIILESNQSFISFEIAFIDYSINSNNSYKCFYKLRNFDNNWYEMNLSSNEISFTGLIPGEYTLEIELRTENDHIFSARQIDVYMKPSVWLNNYMKTLYLIILSLIIYVVFSFFRKQKQTKEIIRKTKEKQMEQEKLNALKLDFFTYITHEFKTPLAIISTLQEEILPFNNEEDSDLTIFKRNVKRLEFLVNQLMDFRNMESNHTSISIKKYDMIGFLKEIYEAFAPLFKHKDITSGFLNEVESFPMLFDSDKIEMLVGNLLSNAFKHTDKGGYCYLKVYIKDNHLIVEIFNSGNYITDEKKTAIFQPYYRTDSKDQFSNTGIGLAIVNSISKLLDIQLSVEAVENEGNLFRAAIPILQDDKLTNLSPENSTGIVENIISNTIYLEEQASKGETEAENKNNFRILIAEDDVDSRKVLKKKLQKFYHVFPVSSGKDALLIMKSQHVDLVISDIHMGEMDGYELCRKIKMNEKSKHIPVLLITSDLSSEAKIRGFQAGADAFIQKPINIQELLLRLENILKNKNVLRDYYASFNQFKIETPEANNADEIFIREITQYIHEHLADANLSVHHLAQYMNISRTQLYLTIKRLTDQTPSSFVLTIKMEQASKLLLSSGMTSSEISYKLGYCNPNHFSRQFKEFYQQSPTEYRKSKKHKLH